MTRHLSLIGQPLWHFQGRTAAVEGVGVGRGGEEREPEVERGEGRGEVMGDPEICWQTVIGAAACRLEAAAHNTTTVCLSGMCGEKKAPTHIVATAVC